MKKSILVAAAGALMALGLAGCGSIEIDPSEYVNVSFEGYDTIGTANVEFDYKHFIRDYEEDLKLTSEGKKNSDDLEEEAEKAGFDDTAADMLAVYIKGKLDKTDALSNGDKVNYEWEVDADEVAKYFNCNLVLEDLSFTVKDLTEAEAFDPFEDFSVTFSGTAPNGYLQMSSYSSSKCSEVYFEADKQDNLSNGDIVKITIYDAYTGSKGEAVAADCVKNSGKLPTVFEKEFTVSGLPSYVLSEADIAPDTLKKMQKQCEDVIDAYAASWSDFSSLMGKHYLGMYVITPKEGISASNKAVYTLVYRIDCLEEYTSKKGDLTKIVSTYYPIQFYDIVELEDGTQSLDLSNYRKSNNSWKYDTGISDGWWGTTTWSYTGFENLDNAFNEYITKNVEKWQYESSVADVEFKYEGFDAEGYPVE